MLTKVYALLASAFAFICGYNLFSWFVYTEKMMDYKMMRLESDYTYEQQIQANMDKASFCLESSLTFCNFTMFFVVLTIASVLIKGWRKKGASPNFSTRIKERSNKK
jgi:hypothetical protein